MMATRIALLLALLMTVGCTTANTYPTRGEQLPHNAAFSEVAVSIDSSLAASRLLMFRQHRGAHLLRESIVAQLEAQGRIDPSAPHRLEVRVVGMRLRTWLDSLLGTLVTGEVEIEDFLTVDVVVHERNATTLQTGASAASNRNAFLFLHERGRLANLSRAIAKVLTAEI